MGLVPPTAAHFSFEMDVVLVGVAVFFVCISCTPDFHVRARANVCVSVYLSVCFVSVCVCIADQLFTIVGIMYSVSLHLLDNNT